MKEERMGEGKNERVKEGEKERRKEWTKNECEERKEKANGSYKEGCVFDFLFP